MWTNRKNEHLFWLALIKAFNETKIRQELHKKHLFCVGNERKLTRLLLIKKKCERHNYDFFSLKKSIKLCFERQIKKEAQIKNSKFNVERLSWLWNVILIRKHYTKMTTLFKKLNQAQLNSTLIKIWLKIKKKSNGTCDFFCLRWSRVEATSGSQTKTQIKKEEEEVNKELRREEKKENMLTDRRQLTDWSLPAETSRIWTAGTKQPYRRKKEHECCRWWSAEIHFSEFSLARMKRDKKTEIVQGGKDEWAGKKQRAGVRGRLDQIESWPGKW